MSWSLGDGWKRRDESKSPPHRGNKRRGYGEPRDKNWRRNEDGAKVATNGRPVGMPKVFYMRFRWWLQKGEVVLLAAESSRRPRRRH